MGRKTPGSGSGPAGGGVTRTRPCRDQKKYRGPDRRLAAIALLAALVFAGSADLNHIVAGGENLTRIARKYGTTPEVVAAANGLKNPSLIFAGQTLVIPRAPMPTPPKATPPPVRTLTHVVARGENLTQIASKYGTTAATLAKANGIRNPSLIKVGQKIQVPSSFRPGVEGMLERYSFEFGADPALVKALAWQESGWQQKVVSSAGAVGVMQLLPETAAFTSRYLLKVPVDINDTAQNVRAGVRFFAYLLTLTGGDQQLAVAGYFQGLRSVRTVGVSPKTARYVANVMALVKRFS